MVRYVRDNFYRPLSTKLQSMGQTLYLLTANEEVALWLENVAHQRIHDTTKEKPALRLIEERQALQTLPPQLISIATALVHSDPLPSTLSALSQQPLHHSLSVYDDLAEVI